MTKYRYFIYFRFQNDESSTINCARIILEFLQKITTIDDIRNIEVELMKQPMYKKALVANFILLDTIITEEHTPNIVQGPL